MALDSDSLRLRMLKACGAQEIVVGNGSFWAIFDREYLGVDAGELEVEERSPVLTCRTSDVETLGLTRGSVLHVSGSAYRIVRHEPDGTGMSRLILAV